MWLFPTKSFSPFYLHRWVHTPLWTVPILFGVRFRTGERLSKLLFTYPSTCVANPHCSSFVSSRTNRFCSCEGTDPKSYPSFLIDTFAGPLSGLPAFVPFLNEVLGETDLLFSSIPLHYRLSLFLTEFFCCRGHPIKKVNLPIPVSCVSAGCTFS